jgi:hypothetical protein
MVQASLNQGHNFLFINARFAMPILADAMPPMKNFDAFVYKVVGFAAIPKVINQGTHPTDWVGTPV